MNVKEPDDSNVTDTSSLTFPQLGSSSIEQNRKCTKRKKCIASYNEEQQERIRASKRKYSASLNEEQREKQRESYRRYSAKLNEEQREKRRESNRKYQASLSEEQREKRRAYNRQYHANLTEEKREKLRANLRMYQNSLTEEQREKRRANSRKYRNSLTDEQREKQREKRRVYLRKYYASLNVNCEIKNKYDDSLDGQSETSCECPTVSSVNSKISNEYGTSLSEIKDEKNETSCDEYQLRTKPANESNYMISSGDQCSTKNEYQISSTDEKAENSETSSDGKHCRGLPTDIRLERKKESNRKYVASLTGERLEKYKASRRASALKYARSLTQEEREKNKAKRLQYLAALPEEELEKRRAAQRESVRRYRIMMSDEQRAMHKATTQSRMKKLRLNHAALINQEKCTPEDSYVYCNVPDTSKHSDILVKEEVAIEYSPESSDHEQSEDVKNYNVAEAIENEIDIKEMCIKQEVEENDEKT